MEIPFAQQFALMMYIVPASLLFIGFLVRVGIMQSVEQVFQIGRATTTGLFILSFIATAIIFFTGAIVSPIIGIDNIGISLRLDALSIALWWLVSFMGMFIIQFSRNYLDGDNRHAHFLGGLYTTIGAVLFLVLSGNLWQLVIGWIGTSLALHQLLVFYHDRPRAISAAHKKFVVARLGDACLVIAAILIARAFGTSDLGAIFEATQQANAENIVPAGVGIAGILVVLAASLKSAMFPTHGWLLEVMETPTPVSALLHAGLLNAGTFLVVRLGYTIFLSPVAPALLIIIGGFTAIFASSAMITQNSVKVSLAYSSAAHMGFMLMLCGFGAHSIAIMHLIAHSFYKAHAFLSSGSIVEYTQNTGKQKLNTAPSPAWVAINLVLSLSIFSVIAYIIGIDVTQKPYEMALGAIFIIAITHLLNKGTLEHSPAYVIGRTMIMAVAVTVAFFSLELVAAWLLSSAVATVTTPTTITFVVMFGAVFAFGIVTMLGSFLPILVQRPAWRAFYVHLKNGFYANTLFDRLISSSR